MYIFRIRRNTKSYVNTIKENNRSYMYTYIYNVGDKTHLIPAEVFSQLSYGSKHCNNCFRLQVQFSIFLLILISINIPVAIQWYYYTDILGQQNGFLDYTNIVAVHLFLFVTSRQMKIKNKCQLIYMF